MFHIVGTKDEEEEEEEEEKGGNIRRSGMVAIGFPFLF